MTLPVDLYPYFALASSSLILALFTAHSWNAAAGYQMHHDDRAAFELLIALTLTVAAIGMTMSASASFVGSGNTHPLRELGLGMMRGALVVTGSVLFLADRAHRARHTSLLP